MIKKMQAVVLAGLLLLSGCNQQGFTVKHLAKSDIDMMTDIVLLDMQDQLAQLLVKLYKRNPRELAKAATMSVEKRLSMIEQQTARLRFDELQRAEEVAAMNLAFSETFRGDRVFALMVGLTGMIRQAYNYDNDFYLYDDLDAQRLYNSARNIEVLVWKLNNKKQVDGSPFIITSSRNGVIDNTSFERIYGKLIHTQDIMAKVIADRDNRTINTVIKGTLSVFLPI